MNPTSINGTEIANQAIAQICRDYAKAQSSATAPAIVGIESFAVQAPVEFRSTAWVELERIQNEWIQFYESQDDLNRTTHVKHAVSVSEITPPCETPSLVGWRQRFQMEEVLGRGGSGVVWKALDLHLKRHVALKISHANDTQSTKPFLREGQAAARLNHPNIARVLEVGCDEEGCFLISELVDGISLAKHLRDRRFSIRETVDLLIDVSEALSYAHAMGIVHRDMKPQNIMIDPTGSAKLVDFGLAKDFQNPEIVNTKSGAVAGTPAYMSPEQASGSEAKTHVTTDIYSLGVIFYQLLTGEIPFRGTPPSVIVQVMHVDPPSPRQLNREIPTELETLCTKCMEKKPSDRFQSAQELREELCRFRDGIPIRSQPLSVFMIAKKWILRNRVVAGWIATSFALLLTTAIVTSIATWMIAGSLQREREQRIAAQKAEMQVQAALDRERFALREAKQQATSAARESQLSQETLRFLESLFQSSDPIIALLSGKQNSAREIPSLKSLVDAAAIRLRNELADQPSSQARLLDTLANSYRAAGEFARANELLDEAASKRSFDSNSAATVHSLRDQAMHWFFHGLLEHDQSHWQDAEKFYRQSLEMTHSQDREGQLARAEILFQMGRLHLEQGKNHLALPWLRESLEIRSQHLPADSVAVRATQIGLVFCDGTKAIDMPLDEWVNIIGNSDWAAEIARAYTESYIHRKTKKYELSIDRHQEVNKRLTTILPEKHPIVLLALGDYAGLLGEAGEHRLAYQVATDIIALGSEICPDHDKLVRAKIDFANELIFAKKFSTAAQYYEDALAIRSSKGIYSDEIHYGLVWCYLEMGDLKSALAHANALWEHREGNSAHHVAWIAFSRARVLDALNEPEQSKEMHDRALAEAKKSASNLPNHAIWLERLSKIHLHHHDWSAAEVLSRKAVEWEIQNRPPHHPRIADRSTTLARALIPQGKISEARQLLTESLQSRRKRLPEDDLRIEENSRLLSEIGSL